MKYSVIIPVYKNKSLFFENLRHNQRYFRNHEVVIVDDHSDENIPSEIKALYPKYIVLENEKNRGFGPTMNRGVEKATGDILIFLNTDVKLEMPFEHLNEFFKNDPQLFAVTFAQLEKNGWTTGKNRIFFKNGFVQHSSSQDVFTGENAWAEGGASAVRATMFRELGGFREIYAPFYWEDIDVSYRAHKQGWSITFDHDYVVEHQHESTIGTFFSRFTIRRTAYRNQFYFIWTNITDPSFLFQHIVNIPLYALRTLLNGDMAFIVGLAMALLSLPQVLVTRHQNQKNARMKDIDVFATLNRK